MTVKINKHFTIQSVIFNLPNVLKDVSLIGANLVQLLRLRCSLIYMSAKALSAMQLFILLILIFSQTLTFSKIVLEISVIMCNTSLSMYMSQVSVG